MNAYQIIRTAATAVLVMSILSNSGLGANFQLTDLGITQFSYFIGTNGGLDINNSTTVVGTQTHPPDNTNDGNRAVIWTQDGGVQELGTLGGSWSYAWGLNNAGQVVGYSEISGGPYHGFVWSSSGGMIDVGALSGSASLVSDINNSGLAAGQYFGTENGAFVWSDPVGMTDIGNLGGLTDGARAFAVNDSGQVVGWSGGITISPHAFVWSEGAGMQDLVATLDNIQGSDAFDINNAGMIVGRVVSSTNGNNAVMWDSSGNLTTLGLGFATGINASNQVVGFRSEGAFLWEEGIGQQQLILTNGLEGFLTRVDAINDLGQIVGWLSTGDSDLLRAVLLTPTDSDHADVTTTLEWRSDTGSGHEHVPETSNTLALLMLTTTGISLLRRWWWKSDRDWR